MPPLARSPWEAPPLLFCRRDGVLAAASVARVLHACGLAPEINRQRIADNLFFNLKPPEGWYVGIERVGRGEIVHLSEQGSRRTAFYDELKPWPILRLDRREAIEATDALLNEAVAATLRSTKRPGMLLSGGLDSPNVAARICRTLPEGGVLRSYTSEPHRDWSGWVHPGYFAREEPFVRDLAAMYPNLVPRFLDNPDQDFDARLTEMFLAIGSAPINLQTVSPLHSLYAAAASDGCDLMINAGLGNFSFSMDGLWAQCEYLLHGKWRQLYRLYKDDPARDRPIYRSILHNAIEPVIPAPLQRFLGRWRYTPAPFAGRSIVPLTDQAVEKYALEDRARAHGMLDDRPFWRSRQVAWQEGIGRGELEGGDIHCAFEQIHGLRTRDATAYRPLIEFCRQLPTEVFASDGIIRRLAKDLGRPYLPASIVDTHQFGFSNADRHWRVKRRLPELREELRRARQNPDIAEMIDFDAVERRIDAYPDEATSFADHMNYGYALGPVVITSRFVNWATGRNDP